MRKGMHIKKTAFSLAALNLLTKNIEIIIKKGRKSTIGRMLNPSPYHQHHQDAVTYKKIKKGIKKTNFLCQEFFENKINNTTANNKGV